jgi:hypothetical protein
MRAAIASAAATYASWRGWSTTPSARVLAAKIALGLVHC